MSRPCAICGGPDAWFGFRLRGRLSELPEGQREYLFACGTCRQEADARKADGDRKAGRSA